MEITKEEFDDILSVAISAQAQVFEKIKPNVEKSAAMCEEFILGDVGTAALESDEKLAKAAKEYIALDAFDGQIARLDLVLTPTGFGIVSNSNVAPASKERVDALRREVSMATVRARGKLITRLTEVEGWGDTEQGRHRINTIMYDVARLEAFLARRIDINEWAAARVIISSAEARMRKYFGTAQWEDLLRHIRNSQVFDTAYFDFLFYAFEIVGFAVMKSPAEGDAWQALIAHVEGNLDTFTAYRDSQEYKANHYERYENTKDSAAFIFAG